MKRIAIKQIFIGDLPRKSHEKDHLLYNEKEFDNWLISDGFYNKDRFNVNLDLND